MIPAPAPTAEATLPVVFLDGDYADLVSPFQWIAAALLDRPVVCKPSTPPHTIRRLSVSAGLTPAESDEVLACIAALPHFWASENIDPRPDAVVPHGPTVFYAMRVPTKGAPVLEQTIKWLRKHGIVNPIVWVQHEV